MASDKQIKKWTLQAEKINNDPRYIKAFVEYKQIAKRADQQLVRLEALSYEEHFKGVMELSYKRAVRDIRSWGGDRRFNTAPPTTVTELEAKVSDIKEFLSKPTSTKTKIVKIYQKMANTINEKYAKEYGVTFTWQEIANYYESDIAKRGDMQKASKTVVRALAVMKKINTDKQLKEIKDTNQRIELASEDKVVNSMVKRLQEQGLSYDNLKE